MSDALKKICDSSIMRKTITVQTENGNKWYRYIDKQKYQESHKRVYSDEEFRVTKCRKLFIKGLLTSKSPHKKSILKYRPTDEELEMIIHVRREDPNLNVFDYCNRIKFYRDRNDPNQKS